MRELVDPDGPVVVRADGLVLREWSLRDVPAMVGLFDEAEVDRWTPLASPFDETAAREYVERAHRNRAAGTWQLAITEGAEPLGEVLLFPTDMTGTCELGYSVGAAFRGRGLAARAVTVLLSRAAEMGYREARLSIAVGNEASNRVALAAGFGLSGEPLQRHERKGYVLDLATWSRVLPGPERRGA